MWQSDAGAATSLPRCVQYAHPSVLDSRSCLSTPRQPTTSASAPHTTQESGTDPSKPVLSSNRRPSRPAPANLGKGLRQVQVCLLQRTPAHTPASAAERHEALHKVCMPPLALVRDGEGAPAQLVGCHDALAEVGRQRLGGEVERVEGLMGD